MIPVNLSAENKVGRQISLLSKIIKGHLMAQLSLRKILKNLHHQ